MKRWSRWCWPDLLAAPIVLTVALLLVLPCDIVVFSQILNSPPVCTVACAASCAVAGKRVDSADSRTGGTRQSVRGGRYCRLLVLRRFCGAYHAGKSFLTSSLYLLLGRAPSELDL